MNMTMQRLMEGVSPSKLNLDASSEISGAVIVHPMGKPLDTVILMISIVISSLKIVLRKCNRKDVKPKTWRFNWSSRKSSSADGKTFCYWKRGRRKCKESNNSSIPAK
eukprot:TRINITY_DN16996_c0_g1_i1.p2 TRINITY_DN16996_c0_g1~~TRINITY_DN16996_c0_g1_i1.p2  ORF type:complete len:108 (-),score=16.92 TRINITY_DN16996_c0_g1_i1:394-717(-)